MLQVQKELEKKDPDSSKSFHCCWFNIWHFEKEQQILSAFLSRIFSTLEAGLKGGFRGRLFFNKVRKLSFPDKLKFWTAFWILLPVPFLIFLLLLVPFSWEGYFDRIALLKGIGEFAQGIGEKLEGNDLWIGGGGTGLGLGGAIYYLRQLFFESGLNSFFSLSPFKKGNKKLMNEDEGTRQRYKKEFAEIMKAGFREDRNLVIFIDDLDRVDGQKIKDLLTAMNFISDTASDRDLLEEEPDEEEGIPQEEQGANIFFVIGMDCDQVTGNLNKVMEEEEKDPEYGSRYLEKLFDLVVQVPQMKNTESITTR
jgi:hypothetical protein